MAHFLGHLMRAQQYGLVLRILSEDNCMPSSDFFYQFNDQMRSVNFFSFERASVMLEILEAVFKIESFIFPDYYYQFRNDLQLLVYGYEQDY